MIAKLSRIIADFFVKNSPGDIEGYYWFVFHSEIHKGRRKKAAPGTAKKSCGAASWWECYQPKEPAAFKKMMNKK